MVTREERIAEGMALYEEYREEYDRYVQEFDDRSFVVIEGMKRLMPEVKLMEVAQTRMAAALKKANVVKMVVERILREGADSND